MTKVFWLDKTAKSCKLAGWPNDLPNLAAISLAQYLCASQVKSSSSLICLVCFSGTMTTFMLEEIDWTTRPINTTVNVCYNVTSHPDMLTEKELEAVTTAFKTFETGVREATIYPKV